MGIGGFSEDRVPASFLGWRLGTVSPERLYILGCWLCCKLLEYLQDSLETSLIGIQILIPKSDSWPSSFLPYAQHDSLLSTDPAQSLGSCLNLTNHLKLPHLLLRKNFGSIYTRTCVPTISLWLHLELKLCLQAADHHSFLLESSLTWQATVLPYTGYITSGAS